MNNLFIYFAVILTSIPVFTIAQTEVTDTPVLTTAADSGSKIHGPLVTLHEDSFADTLMVLLQSLYYNNHEFVLEKQTAAVTVLGVDLMIELEGTLTLIAVTVQKDSVSADGNIIDLTMAVPAMLVNKTYSIRSAEDPDYTSKGVITLLADGIEVYVSMSSTQIPYYVDSVRGIAEGTMETTIHGEGIPVAEEIQEALQEIVKTKFTTEDVSGFYTDVHSKLVDIFNKNELILCLSCDQKYCQCYE